MATCSTCQAQTKWAKFRDSGRFVMLDPDPVPGGNLAMKSGYPDNIPRVWVVRPEELDGYPVQLGLDPEDDRPLAWRAHFSTCPQADQHRRR